jgi:anti-sigma factor RsiW
MAAGQGDYPAGRHVVELLSAYLDGDLHQRAAESVHEHLAACPPCARAADELRAMVASARALDRPEPPPTLWPAIEGALARDDAPLLAWRRFFVRGFAFGGLAGAAVALLLVLGWRWVSPAGSRPPAAVERASEQPSAPAGEVVDP